MSHAAYPVVPPRELIDREILSEGEWVALEHDVVAAIGSLRQILVAPYAGHILRYALGLDDDDWVQSQVRMGTHYLGLVRKRWSPVSTAPELAAEVMLWCGRIARSLDQRNRSVAFARWVAGVGRALTALAAGALLQWWLEWSIARVVLGPLTNVMGEDARWMAMAAVMAGVLAWAVVAAVGRFLGGRHRMVGAVYHALLLSPITVLFVIASGMVFIAVPTAISGPPFYALAFTVYPLTLFFWLGYFTPMAIRWGAGSTWRRDLMALGASVLRRGTR